MNLISGICFVYPNMRAWYDGDAYAGFMELSIVLPEVIPNRVRK